MSARAQMTCKTPNTQRTRFATIGDICAEPPNDQLTDRRRKRALAANPASDKSGASKVKRLAAVRWSAWFDFSCLQSDQGIGNRAGTNNSVASTSELLWERFGWTAKKPQLVSWLQLLYKRAPLLGQCPKGPSAKLLSDPVQRKRECRSRALQLSTLKLLRCVFPTKPLAGNVGRHLKSNTRPHWHRASDARYANTE
jgi:hypothetical protein